MPEKTFDYGEKKSGIFAKVKRPLVTLEIKTHSGEWLKLQEVLADTGADISILPRDVAELILEDFKNGKYQEIMGIVPFSKLVCYIHNLTFRIDSKEFILPVAVADSDSVPPIIGRVKGLDIFEVLFNGKQTKLRW